jgi:hypothetical protein
MKQQITKIISAATVLVITFNQFVFAEDKKQTENVKTEVKTSILPSEWNIWDILNYVLVTMTAGVVIAAIGSVVVAGVLYTSAGSNSSQVQKAKTMITNTIIGVLAYAVMWAILEWLIPGGVL